jgi:hypothetical protein
MGRMAPPIRSLRSSAVLAAGATALAGALLGGCNATRTAFGPLQYDKGSPAAPAIASTSVQGVPYPSFLDVPSQPTDVRPISAWNRNIFDTLAARRQLDAFQVAYPQTLYGAEAFAQEARAEATPPPPPAADSAKPAVTPPAPPANKAPAARATPPSPAP